jgi:hypothetical protein
VSGFLAFADLSGTESPLLALNMIARAIKIQHGLTLVFEHVFSCEIEPFKQAYIERNFSPPLLFRDVTELGKKRAHTAYGSLAEVPGSIDVSVSLSLLISDAYCWHFLRRLLWAQ